MNKPVEVVPLHKTKHFKDWIWQRGIKCPRRLGPRNLLENFYTECMEGPDMETWMQAQGRAWPDLPAAQQHFLEDYREYKSAVYKDKPKRITAVWMDQWITEGYSHSAAKVSRVAVRAHETVADALQRHGVLYRTVYIFVGWPPFQGETEAVVETPPTK